MGQAVGESTPPVRFFKKGHYGERAAPIRSSGRSRVADRRRRAGNSGCPLCGGPPLVLDEPPSLADRREIAILSFEMARRRSEMFVAGGELATPFERRQEARMRALVERGEFDPIFEAPQNLVGFWGKAARQALQHGDMEGPEATPLCNQPAFELRAVGNLHLSQELPDEQVTVLIKIRCVAFLIMVPGVWARPAKYTLGAAYAVVSRRAFREARILEPA